MFVNARPESFLIEGGTCDGCACVCRTERAGSSGLASNVEAAAGTGGSRGATRDDVHR